MAPNDFHQEFRLLPPPSRQGKTKTARKRGEFHGIREEPCGGVVLTLKKWAELTQRRAARLVLAGLILGGRKERQIYVQEDREEYRNTADDRHQLQEDEGEQRAQSDCRFFPAVPRGNPLSTEIGRSEQKANFG